MTYDPERDASQVDRFSYNPTHDYRTVDVDAWADQLFSGFANLDSNGEDYPVVERVVYGTLFLHPIDRESDARDLSFGMWILSLIGSENPYDADAASSAELAMKSSKEVFRGIMGASKPDR